MKSLNTKKQVGLVRLSILQSDKFSKSYQVRRLDYEGATEIFTDTNLCLNYKQSVANHLEDLGIKSSLVEDSVLIITSLSRMFCNDAALLNFLDYCTQARITLKIIEQSVNCAENIGFLKAIEMRSKEYEIVRRERCLKSTENIKNNGRKGLRLITCWQIASTLQQTDMTKTQAAKSLGVRREWIYDNKLHIKAVQDKYLALTAQQLRDDDPLLKRQVLEELGY